MNRDRYTHGHHSSVVAAHATRTIANSAAYLESHLAPGRSLLDVGCGPGSITAEFADRLGPGLVLGIDNSPEVVAQATETFGGSGTRFQTMDLYELDLQADSFDIVHAHQVLQHVTDPVAALREMRRVVRPGGLVAVRDADYAAMHWAPAHPGLDRWLDIYRAVAKRNDAEPDAGRYLLGWAQQAGFREITPSATTWLFADEPGRQWWAESWANRVVHSALADQAIELGVAGRADLEGLAAAWRAWAAEPDAWFVVVHAELLCRG